jgi:hypothetical protein
MVPENLNHNGTYCLIPNSAALAGSGPCRILGLSWQYDTVISSSTGSAEIIAYVNGTRVLDTGPITAENGAINVSALSNGKAFSVAGGVYPELSVTLTLNSPCNATGDLSVDVYVGYGDLCQA